MRSVTAASAASTVSESGRPTTSRSKILPAVLAQAEALGEEEEVELAPLGGLREVDERREVGLAARLRVAPHGRVVHAREVRGEVDLLHDAYLFAGRGNPKRSRSVMPGACVRRSGATSVANHENVAGESGSMRKPSAAVAASSSASAVALPRSVGRFTSTAAACANACALVGLVDEHDVGAARRERSRWLVARVHEDQRLALRRPRGDRRSPHAEERPFEVDVVHLVTVEVAAGRLVADDGVVLPAVPEPRDDFDRVVGFRIELVERLGMLASEPVGGLVAGRDGDPPSRAAERHEVERRHVLRHVERLGVRRRDRGHEADRRRRRRDAGHRKQGVGTVGRGIEAVVEAHEVEAGALGDLRELDEALGFEQRHSGAVEGDAQVERPGGHDRSLIPTE